MVYYNVEYLFSKLILCNSQCKFKVQIMKLCDTMQCSSVDSYQMSEELMALGNSQDGGRRFPWNYIVTLSRRL
jgi:hypothetical protein